VSKLDLTPESFSNDRAVGASGEKGRPVDRAISSRPNAHVNGIIGGYTARFEDGDSAEASPNSSVVVGQEPARSKGVREYVFRAAAEDCTAEFGDHSSAPAIALDWT